MLALVDSVCLFALSRSNRHVLALLISAGLDCGVLCCAFDRCTTETCSCVRLKKRATETRKKTEMEKEKALQK